MPQKVHVWFVMSALALLAPAVLAGNFYAGTSPANVPWPGGMVPYAFAGGLSTNEQQTYLDGLREWELAAKVKFVPYTNQARYILFDYNTNFLDYVASGYSPQLVTVSSLSRAQVCHEMGHSFGFTHENIRTDQTNYLTILTNNILDESTNIFWFTIDPNSVTNGNYDFESVMHLGWDFRSTLPGVAATQQPRPPYFPRYQFRMGNLCLSPGDRAALAYLYGPPTVPLTNIVTTTADVGPGSLRAALYYVTDHPGAIVRFNIPSNDPGFSNGVFTIYLTGMLPPLATNGMVIDGSTQPGFAGNPLIVVDGSQIIPETFTSNSGLLIYSSSNQVKNISFSGFNWNGLTLEFADATNNTIAGCWLGLDATGTNAAPNAFQGILFGPGAGHNLIGGTNALARNVISGNSQYGLWMTDTNTTGNVILGNYIGTDASGSVPVPNVAGGIGIFTNGVDHVIGGTNAGARNVISGNGGTGIFLSGVGVSNNIVRGNFLGLNAAGTSGVLSDSGSGIYVTSGAASNSILGNVISSNHIGLFISDPGTRGNVFQGNLIGTDSTGKLALPNGYEGITVLNGAASNLIGGMVAGAANVISGNLYGLVIDGSGASDNVVEGNLIGVDITGKTEVPGVYEGIVLGDGAASNIIGGTVAGAGNVIAGNYNNLAIGDPGTSGNWIQGNLIGLDITGKTALTNQYQGITMGNGAASNLIGGTVTGAANVIAGSDFGILIGGANTSGNWIEGNLIGPDITGTNAIGNAFNNVQLQNGASGNFIGGVAPGAGNVIAFSAYGDGVNLYDPGTMNNAIRGNSIFGNSGLGIELSNYYVTTNHTGFLAGPNDLQNYPVITNAYGYAGSTIVAGQLNSLPGSAYFIDVYRNPVADPSGYGEGQFYVGTVSVTTDGSGNAVFALATAAGNYTGQSFSATATSAGGDTSEFSADVTATNAPAPLQFTGPYARGSNGFAFGLLLQSNQAYTIQTATNLAAHPIVWLPLTNFTATAFQIQFTDRSATNLARRFYRVISP